MEDLESGGIRIRPFRDADNPAAHAVLERNGFSREGLLRGWGARGDQRVDALVFGRVSAPPE